MRVITESEGVRVEASDEEHSHRITYRLGKCGRVHAWIGYDIPTEALLAIVADREGDSYGAYQAREIIRWLEERRAIRRDRTERLRSGKRGELSEATKKIIAEDMIMRVAKAIHNSSVFQPETGVWNDERMTPPQTHAVEAARRAVMAMRNPTYVMRMVATFAAAEVDYPAMIDAALAGPATRSPDIKQEEGR